MGVISKTGPMVRGAWWEKRTCNEQTWPKCREEVRKEEKTRMWITWRRNDKEYE